MNNFEVVLLFSPELSTSVINSELDKFNNLIGSKNGKVKNSEDWGLRELSYAINKFNKAFYKFFQIEISGKELKNIKSDLNQSDNILRYIFIKVKSHQELPTKLNYEKK